MLTIENKEKLNNQAILRHTTDGYYIEGVYEWKDHYLIQIHCSNKTISNENFILLRNRVADKHTNYYTLYNSNHPQRRLNLTIPQIRWKEMFLHNIETILKMKN